MRAAVQNIVPGAPAPDVYLLAIPQRGRSVRRCRSRSSRSRITIQLVRVEQSLVGRLDLMVARAMSSSVCPGAGSRLVLDYHGIGIGTLYAP